MKYAITALLAALCAAPALAQDDPPAKGLFEERCGVCHDTEENGAPATDKLKALEPAAIVEKTTTGTMASMASGITPQQIREIAVYLTSKPLPATADLPEVKPAG